MKTALVAACVALALAGCASRRDAAPVIDRAPPSAGLSRPAPSSVPSRAAQEGFYVVRRGDTLYSIALEHGADYREVADWNGLSDPTKINVGQQLRVIPPPEREGVQVGTARTSSGLEARPLGATETAKAQTRAPAKETPAVAAREGTVPGGEPVQFIWPAKGKVIAGFAGPRSKGIDIDGKPGDPIVAAAAGRVTYIGSGIPGLGKLVVIKHDSGFITVYAHNREILVKEQQAVNRGQKIAELGSTDAERPKLHFQIRKGSAAVDPIRYLPGS